VLRWSEGFLKLCSHGGNKVENTQVGKKEDAFDMTTLSNQNAFSYNY